MDEVAATRWDERYANAGDMPPAADVLTRYHYLLPTSGVALDLACGRGSNAHFLATKGLETHAWDISSNAISQLQLQSKKNDIAIQIEVRDVVERPPSPQSFDVIVVSRFLDRSIVDAIVAALRPGGVLFYQTFVVGNQGGPTNPAYLLAEGELLSLFKGLTVRAFEDAGQCGRVSEGFRNEALIVAQKDSPVPQQASDNPGVEKTMSQIDTFEAMLARGQDSDMLRLTLGNAYWKEKNFAKAIEHLEFAVEKNPQYSAAWKVLGRVLTDAGKPQQAKEAYESGLEVANKNGDKQTVKEITVFLKRVNKTLNPPTDSN